MDETSKNTPVSILTGIRDNLLKPMRNEIVACVEKSSNANKNLLIILTVFTLINTAAILAIVYKIFWGQ